MLVETLADAKKVVRYMSNKPWVAYDTETAGKNSPVFKLSKDGLIWGRQDIVAFALCHRGEAYSFVTNRVLPDFPSIHEYAPLLRALFCAGNVIVAHNANYDCMVTRPVTGRTPRHLWDTMHGAWMADMNKANSLKERAILYGRYLQQTRSVNFADKDQLTAYVEDDAIATDELYQMQLLGVVKRPKILRWRALRHKPVPNEMPDLRVSLPSETLDKFEQRFLQLQELPVLRATMRAESKGVYYDRGHNAHILARAEEDMTAVKKRLFKKAGTVFNLDSPKQVSEVLTVLGVNITTKTKTGAPSVNAESLFYLKGKHPIVDDIVEYRQVSKLVSTYLGPRGLTYFINPETGRIHPGLNSLGARTGRFSSSNPNLMQIPSRKDRYEIKYGFRASRLGRKLICLDYSQIEIRVMCLFAQDPLMTEVLNDPNGDIHQTTANKFGVPRDPVAKFCNFNLQYKGGGYMLSKIITLAGVSTTPEQGEEYKRQYDSTYHRVPAFREEMYDFHKKNGYFPMMTGRKMVIEGLDAPDRSTKHKAETQAANNLIQGSAQDILKAAIVRLDPKCIMPDELVPKYIDISERHAERIAGYAKKLRKYRKLFKQARLDWLLQVHDEMLFEVDAGAAVECAERIAEVMTWLPYFEPIVEFCVPIRVEGGVGDTWGAAKGKAPEHKIAV